MTTRNLRPAGNTETPQVSAVMESGAEKVNSIVYKDFGGVLGTYYVPRDVLAKLGNPARVRMTLEPAE
jgi:hypothetical protein